MSAHAAAAKAASGGIASKMSVRSIAIGLDSFFIVPYLQIFIFSGHTTSVDRKWAQGNKCIRIHFGEKKCAGIPWHLLCGFFGEERFGQRRNRGAGRLGQVGKRYVFFGGTQESPMRNFTGKMILRGAPVYTPLMRSMISLAASSPMMESGRSMSVMRGSR